jgi:diamine N-acetyltransferase
MTKGNKTGRVYLRALESEDLDRTHKWHNDPELYQTLVGPFRYVSRASEEEWLNSMQKYSCRQVNLAICLTSGEEHIGNVYLRDIDWISRHGELHTFIADSAHQSKGYGQAAIRLLITYAFEQLGLLRLYLFVLDENKRAIRAYEKCGFVAEGKLRRHAFKGGKYSDVVVMGICAT